MKPPRILGGQSKKIEKSYKFPQKVIDSATVIIIAIGYVIFLINYPPMPL